MTAKFILKRKGHVYSPNNISMEDIFFELSTSQFPTIGELLIIDNKSYIIERKIRIIKNIYEGKTSTEDIYYEISEN